MDKGKSLTEQGRAILLAAASGKIAIDECARLLQGIGALARVAELDELEQRIQALEEEKT